MWKSLVKSIFIIILGLLISPIIILGGLNYSGMCLSEQLYFSDEKKLRSAIVRVNNSTTVSIKTKTRGVQVYPQMKYANVDSFIKENPNCCQLNPPVDDNIMLPGFFLRTFKGVNDVALVSYKARYKDEEGKIQSQQVNEYLYLMNCGTARLGMWH